jgi:hypothetical protein
LLESFRQTARRNYLDAVLLWNEFLCHEIGFQSAGAERAVNYFARRGDEWVPNNSAIVLRMFAELADVTGNEDFLRQAHGLLSFLRRAQLTSGEIPYVAGRPGNGPQRVHFQCFQYNAFLCLDLIRYVQLTGDREAEPLIVGLLRFVRNGLADAGYAFYACDCRYRTVNYHTAVLAAAFKQAATLGISGYEGPAKRAYAYLLTHQRPDGSFSHSRGDYRILRDERSYPRYLAMILYQLVSAVAVEQDQVVIGENSSCESS